MLAAMTLPRSADCVTLVEIAAIGNNAVTASVGQSGSGHKPPFRPPNDDVRYSS